MQEDIVKLLGLYRPKRVVTDFDRENLIFISKKVSREAAGNYIRAYCPPCGGERNYLYEDTEKN
mgnify:CR=1 FL=1